MPYTPEIEFKFPLPDVTQVIARLDEIAIKTHERRLLRSVNCRREDNPSFQNMDILRLRDEGNGQVYLTMKQRWQEHVELDHTLEKECLVGDFDLMADMIQHLGLFVSVRAEKYRTTWELGDCEIVLDENPWIDPYFEIEGPSEEAIQKVCELIECPWDLRTKVSARVLYTEKYGPAARDIREITFMRNTFVLG